jgi:molybdate/tungstate transport system substrate-binding protein
VTGQVDVLHAGVLTDLVGRGLAPALLKDHGIQVSSVGGHSVGLAMRILDGRLEGDVYLSADARTNALLSGPAGRHLVTWFLVFARNSVVLAYSRSGPFADAFERVRQREVPWYEVMRRPGIRLARNDPNLDPLGYYTLLVCSLAEEHYKLPGLRSGMLGDDLNPEQVGRAGFPGLADGSIHAMFLYRSAAIGRGFGIIELPDEINLGNADMATSYARVGYTTTDGHEFRGAPISHSAGVLSSARNPQTALRFMKFLISPAAKNVVREFNFLTSPMLVGGSADRLPQDIADLVEGRYP